MKTNLAIITAWGFLTILTSCAPHNDKLSGWENDEITRREILATIVSNHDLMLQMIGQIKGNDHARMMVNHLLTSEQTSGMDHENCPMARGHAAGTPDSTARTSPYIGQEQRALKSLGPDEVQKYLAGKGMGLAKAAELNHSPGPRHVLALATDLKLTIDQLHATQAAFEHMHRRATDIGKQIVEKETSLNTYFMEGSITNGDLNKMTREIAALQGELRATHLGAHVEMKNILSHDQVLAYDTLRGYADHPTVHSHE